MSSLSLNAISEAPLAAEPPPSIDYFVELQAGGSSLDSSTLGFFNTATIELSAETSLSIARNFVDSVSFVTFAADSKEILSNVENEGTLEISASDVVSNSVSRITTATLEFASSNPIIITTYNFVESAELNIAFSTFAKGYTSLQQAYADDIISLGIGVESIEFFGSTSGVRQRQKQVWFG